MDVTSAYLRESDPCIAYLKGVSLNVLWGLPLALYLPWSMHSPFSTPSWYSLAFEFPVLVLVTTTLAYNMAASSADFEWFNNVDDEHPIGKGPTTSSTATSSSPQTQLLLLWGHQWVLLTVS